MLRPAKPYVAIFLGPYKIESVKLIPCEPFRDVEPMKIYQTVADLIEKINDRLKKREIYDMK
jgi:hypothetical protein